MSAQVHFEIFRQQGNDGIWVLVDAVDERESALERAKNLLAHGQASAVRVVKETYKPDTGDYVSLIIFEDGHVAIEKKKKKQDDGLDPPPCTELDDLYSYPARSTMGRVLSEWLAKNKLTVTELIHSAAALDRLEAAGTVYQHAIQKIAVAQASASLIPVTQLIKQVNALCTAAIERVHRDEHHKLFPELSPGQFRSFMEKLGSAPGKRYILNGVIAKYLASADGWDEKLRRLLALNSELPESETERALLLSAIDSLVAEILNGPAALADILGHHRDLGHALANLVELFLGEIVHVADGHGLGINTLAGLFAQDDLPEARSAIASRIMMELKGSKRLCPDSLEEEFKMLRRLANSLVRAQGKYLSHDDLIAAFTERSKRLVTYQPLQQFMADAKTPDQRFERLLAVEENIIGAENRRTLSTFIMPIITSNGFEYQLLPASPVTQRLRRLAELQERVLRSGFQEVHKNQIALALDSVAQHIDERSKFLSSIESRISNPVERAQTLLKFFAAGTFTQGDLIMKARRLLMASLAKPGFLDSYKTRLEHERHTSVERKDALGELTGQLQSAGVAREDALKVLAA